MNKRVYKMLLSIVSWDSGIGDGSRNAPAHLGTFDMWYSGLHSSVALVAWARWCIAG